MGRGKPPIVNSKLAESFFSDRSQVIRRKLWSWEQEDRIESKEGVLFFFREQFPSFGRICVFLCNEFNHGSCQLDFCDWISPPKKRSLFPRKFRSIEKTFSLQAMWVKAVKHYTWKTLTKSEKGSAAKSKDPSEGTPTLHVKNAEFPAKVGKEFCSKKTQRSGRRHSNTTSEKHWFHCKIRKKL